MDITSYLLLKKYTDSKVKEAMNGDYLPITGGYHNEMWLVDDMHANIVPKRIWANGGYGVMDYHFIDVEVVP